MHKKIFTIDSNNCQDYDDALGLENNVLSVYISNVPLWIEHLNLWNSLSMRVSTIYLPDKKRPMLPTILSDCLCSLQENQERIGKIEQVRNESHKTPTINSSYGPGRRLSRATTTP